MGTARDNDGTLPGRRRRLLSGDEARLWRRAISGVRPIGRQVTDRDVILEAPPPLSSAQEHAAEPAQEASRARPLLRSFVEELVPGKAAGLDKRTLMRLRRGLITPETQIDLHRQTQEEAHRLLGGFLAASQASSRRCVLVITGKGYGSGGAGVLKTMVPRWLNEQPNRGRVLAFCHAVPAHGGEGALYVLLRKVRPPESRRA
jgi:DNA-nicking Smr family endonuclease